MDDLRGGGHRSITGVSRSLDAHIVNAIFKVVYHVDLGKEILLILNESAKKKLIKSPTVTVEPVGTTKFQALKILSEYALG